MGNWGTRRPTKAPVFMRVVPVFRMFRSFQGVKAATSSIGRTIPRSKALGPLPRPGAHANPPRAGLGRVENVAEGHGVVRAGAAPQRRR